MRLPRTLIILILIAQIWSCGNTPDTKTSTNNVVQEFDQFFQNIENFSGNIIVAVDGKTIYSKSIGYANRELLVKNTMDTKFRIGSISKPITALAIMILEEKGLIKTEEKLSTYISDLPLTWENITVHHLLTHTSGLGHLTDFKETKEFLIAPVAIQKVFEQFKKLPLKDIPGKNFHYSGIGYVVLSILIEKVTHRSYESFIEEEIFERLQMTNTQGDDPNILILNRANGYSITSDETVENADFQYLPTKRGAGNMISTVGDLLKLDKAFSTNKLLSEKALNKMIQPHVEYVEMGNTGVYGYGLDIIKSDSINMVFHTGRAPGFEALFYMIPDKKVTIIACANTRVKEVKWRSDFAKLVHSKLSKN